MLGTQNLAPLPAPVRNLERAAPCQCRTISLRGTLFRMNVGYWHRWLSTGVSNGLKSANQSGCGVTDKAHLCLGYFLSMYGG